MSLWLVGLIIALALGMIVGNILLLGKHKKFDIPKDFKNKAAYKDDDEEN